MSVQEALKLGAFDLKKSANRNLAIAFGIALLIIAVLVGYPSAAGIFAEKEPPIVATGPTTLEDFEEMEEEEKAVEEPPPPDEIIPPPPPPPMATTQTIGTGADSRMGQLMASSEDLSDLPDISDMEDVSASDAKGLGDGGRLPDLSEFDPDDEKDMARDEGKVDNTPVDEYPEFIPNATNPTYDQAELQGNITYPRQAEEHGIQGTVSVRVKLDKRGKVVEAVAIKRVDPSLDEEAVRAVRKTTFTPAIQNGQPTGMTITIPVKFVLD